MTEQKREEIQEIVQELINVSLTRVEGDALLKLLDNATILGKDAEAVVTLKMKFKDALK